MSKEIAAAILTQTYFKSSPGATDNVRRQIDADGNKGTTPAKGAVQAVTAVYLEFLKTMPGNQ